MKKIVVIIAILFFNIIANAQKFKGNFSAMIGIPNVKVRLQYEHPISARSSVGLNTNYHFFNWKGPMVEPFARIYSKHHGNEKGVFGQLKMCYGNFTYYTDRNSSLYDLYHNQRFAVYGGGIGGGYKFLMGTHFTLELYSGLRLISGPNETYANLGAYERLGWYFWTGFPVELHSKLGFQF